MPNTLAAVRGPCWSRDERIRPSLPPDPVRGPRPHHAARPRLVHVPPLAPGGATAGPAAGAAPDLTGLHGPEHRATAQRAGFQYHLEKPVDLHSLVGIVESLAHGGMALARRTAELTTV